MAPPSKPSGIRVLSLKYIRKKLETAAQYCHISKSRSNPASPAPDFKVPDAAVLLAPKLPVMPGCSLSNTSPSEQEMAMPQLSWTSASSQWEVNPLFEVPAAASSSAAASSGQEAHEWPAPSSYMIPALHSGREGRTSKYLSAMVVEQHTSGTVFFRPERLLEEWAARLGFLCSRREQQQQQQQQRGWVRYPPDVRGRAMALWTELKTRLLVDAASGQHIPVAGLSRPLHAALACCLWTAIRLFSPPPAPLLEQLAVVIAERAEVVAALYAELREYSGWPHPE